MRPAEGAGLKRWVSAGGSLQEVDDDLLFGLRCLRSHTTSPRGPACGSEGVEPWSFAAQGSAPARRSASTAAEHRFRTARCSGVTPPRATAFGLAPASTRYSMTAR